MEKKIRENKCKYCRGRADTKGMCSYCYQKKSIMHGWHWLYKGEKIIKKED